MKFGGGDVLAKKNPTAATYSQYVASLKPLLASKSKDDFPKLIILTGQSTYLQQRTFQALSAVWDKFDEVGVSQSIETTEINASQFHGLWSQVSLFEPCSLYLMRRANQCRAVAGWLADIKSVDKMQSHFIIEFAEKISADILKQVGRLNGVVIHCVEPVNNQDFERIAESFCKRRQLSLASDAIRLIVESMGPDLAKIENQIEVLSLQFAGVDKTLMKSDIAPSVGSLREDDVFKLFEALRRARWSEAHMLCHQFIERGESALALTGIFSRYAREQIERGQVKKGLSGLQACASADRRLKSSRIDETVIVSLIIDAFAHG